jgi:hypothetical protein
VRDFDGYFAAIAQIGSVKDGGLVAARSDHGQLMPNYSTFLGGVCSGALSNLYYPASSRGAGLVFANAAIGLAERAGENLLREFIYKRLTTHMCGNGKPASGSENH